MQVDRLPHESGQAGVAGVLCHLHHLAAAPKETGLYAGYFDALPKQYAGRWYADNSVSQRPLTFELYAVDLLAARVQHHHMAALVAQVRADGHV